MTKRDIWEAIEAELKRSRAAQPYWPEHVVSQAARVCESPTVMLGIALSLKYEEKDPAKRKEMIAFAVRTAASAIRFLENVEIDQKQPDQTDPIALE